MKNLSKNMFLNEEQLKKFNFKRVGKNVLISNKASIYNPENIEIGDNVRIDDFCILSAGGGGIILGNNIHIAAFCSLIGKSKIIMEDFSGLSSRVSIYSSTDDYSGNYLTNPTVPEEFTNIISKDVILKKHVIVGCGSVILPGVVINELSAIAALSLVTKSIESNVIAGGIPAKVLKPRNNNLTKLECEYLKNIQ